MLRLDYLAYAIIVINILAGVIFHFVTRKDPPHP